jgi:hypothetical protein
VTVNPADEIGSRQNATAANLSRSEIEISDCLADRLQANATGASRASEGISELYGILLDHRGDLVWGDGETCHSLMRDLRQCAGRVVTGALCDVLSKRTALINQQI